MTKVLIIGATGMLGHKLCQQLSVMGFEVAATMRKMAQSYTQFEEIFSNTKIVDGIDVLDEASIDGVLRSFKPDVVVNCVGIIKQHKEAEERYLSAAINAWLPHRLTKQCEAVGARLIHLSTDCVFDGTRGMYKEGELTNACDLYGRTKALGETDENAKNAVTIRTSIIGREISAPKKSLIEWFLSQRGRQIKGFSRAIYTGVTTNEMARVIKIVIEKPELYGLFQVASAPISKYDLLVKLRDAMGLDVEISVDDNFMCDRSLLMERFTNETGYIAPSWDNMLAEIANDPTPYNEWN